MGRSSVALKAALCMTATLDLQQTSMNEPPRTTGARGDAFVNTWTREIPSSPYSAHSSPKPDYSHHGLWLFSYL